MRKVAAGVVAAILLTFHLPAAVADSDPTEEAESYAWDYQVSLPEAQRRLDRSAELASILQAIASTEEGRVAGWGLAHEPTFGGWILLTGSEPASSTSLDLQRANRDITISYGAAHTLDQLESAIDDPTVMSAIPKALLDHIVATDIDILGNSLVLTLDSSSSEQIVNIAAGLESAGSRPLTLTSATQAIASHLEAITHFPFVVDLGSRNVPTDVHGGELLTNSSGTGACTSGFAVLVGSTRAMVSAGHCTVGRHYRSRTTSTSATYYSTNVLLSVFGHNGDAMVYTTSQSESDDFYYSINNTQDATGYKNRSGMMGFYACHFGVSSGSSCGTVTSINFDPRYDECGVLLGCKNQWVKVEGATLKACGGDSGGPWYNASTAYGIQSGVPDGEQFNCTAAGTTFATFMAMSDVLPLLSVSFATT